MEDLTPLWLTGGSCGASFCYDPQQCWENCPTALTADCISGLCQYTFSGPGGGGNNCEESFCTSDPQCTCKDGTLRQCIGGLCQ
jgi:hypothetical protein